MIILPKELTSILDKLNTIKPQARVLVVGGFVRDSLLGLTPKDIDVEIYHVSLEDLRTTLRRIKPGAVSEAGKFFGVFKLKLRHGEVDIALPRTESKQQPGHAGFSITTSPQLHVTQALSRRDFTINALAFDPKSKKIIDPFGGQKDLEEKILRVVNPRTFGDDPLRVYRALQFTARFNLTPIQETKQLLSQMVAGGELHSLAKERITQEITKLLFKSERPSLGFALALEIGLIKQYYPSLFSLTTTEQDPRFHPEGNVWNHSLLSLDAAVQLLKQTAFPEDSKLAILLASLLHDIGKSTTTTKDSSGIHSRGHEEAGKNIAAQLLSSFTLPKLLVTKVIHIIEEHLKPRQLYDALQRKEISEKQYANAVRRLLKRLHPASWNELLVVSQADKDGRGQPIKKFPEGELFSSTIAAQNLELESSTLLLYGRDILAEAKALGVPPPTGKTLGAIINAIEHERDSGTIKTKAQALQKLRTLLKAR